jgi:hypothetical protein
MKDEAYLNILLVIIFLFISNKSLDHWNAPLENDNDID